MRFLSCNRALGGACFRCREGSPSVWWAVRLVFSPPLPPFRPAGAAKQEDFWGFEAKDFIRKGNCEVVLKTTVMAVAGLVALVMTTFPRSAAAAEGPLVVNCHDERLGTVQQTLSGDCKGRVVSNSEAEAIREQRRERIRRTLEKPKRPQIQGRRLAGVGSGFFVSADGSVVTNHHVVDDCAIVTITPSDGDMVRATKVVLADNADLALLRSNFSPPAVATFGTATAEQFALGPASLIGYPNLGLVTIEPILTTVEVVDRVRSTENQPVLVIKGKVRAGNSGGPLLDRGGLVIGVIFAKINSVKNYQLTGKAVRNVGFALSRQTVVSFLDAQGVDYQVERILPERPESLVLREARPFLAQIGCWK